jgi:hypothetical protein
VEGEGVFEVDVGLDADAGFGEVERSEGLFSKPGPFEASLLLWVYSRIGTFVVS